MILNTKKCGISTYVEVVYLGSDEQFHRAWVAYSDRFNVMVSNNKVVLYPEPHYRNGFFISSDLVEFA